MWLPSYPAEVASNIAPCEQRVESAHEPKLARATLGVPTAWPTYAATHLPRATMRSSRASSCSSSVIVISSLV
jgi:hypothetical protein